jgi:uncharacterized protein Usg
MIKTTDVLCQSRLIIAEILYRMPDYPSLLQSFIWQKEDLPPTYPNLKHFLQFWQAELDGKIYMVRVDSKKLYTPTNFIHLDFDGHLN